MGTLSGFGKGKVFATVAALAAITAMLAARANAQRQPMQPDRTGSAPVVRVATYDPQRAFEQSPAQAKLTEEYQSALPALEEAQQKGDQEALQRLQQDLDQKHSRIVTEFQNEVRGALPDIAEKAGVQVVALEVVYTADDVETTDITPQIVGVIADETEQSDAPEQQQPLRPVR